MKMLLFLYLLLTHRENYFHHTFNTLKNVMLLLICGRTGVPFLAFAVELICNGSSHCWPLNHQPPNFRVAAVNVRYTERQEL